MLIELLGVSRSYVRGADAVQALDTVSLRVAAGEFCAIVGPSGSGKSTLLNILGLLDPPTRGTYRLGGNDVTTMTADEVAACRGRHIGFVFQSFQLLPRLTAVENVALGLRYRGVPPDERRAQAMVALARVGLANRALHRPSEMSGGQQQRVAIARAFLGNPSLILADEPTGNLDSAAANGVMDLLCDLNADGGGVTILVVTHDKAVAARCRREIEMRDGRVVRERSDRDRTGLAGPDPAPHGHVVASDVII